MPAACQAFFWWFAPWATRLYADSLGLPMRDYVTGVPVMPAMMPLCLALVAGRWSCYSPVPGAAAGPSLAPAWWPGASVASPSR
ncbi:hypothetical protein [Nonomuraea fuscirosea]|uniref:hypothetical protein n=1 Tax=Nonomuraea fuscirosea TaxID=1291556 RepID=UPI0033FF7FAC